MFTSTTVYFTDHLAVFKLLQFILRLVLNTKQGKPFVTWLTGFLNEVIEVPAPIANELGKDKEFWVKVIPRITARNLRWHPSLVM